MTRGKAPRLDWGALFEAVVSETLEAHGRRLDALAEEIAGFLSGSAAGFIAG